MGTRLPTVAKVSVEMSLPTIAKVSVEISLL